MDSAMQRPSPLVLVVDDDFSMRLLMRAALEKAGYAVVEAEGGAAALEAFAEALPDAVLLDVVMPGMDGFATCRALRKLPGGAHTPVLMVTGLDDIESIHSAFEAGATDFITKPINWVMLGYRVRYLLRASQTFNALAKSQDRLTRAQQIAKLGHWELVLDSGLLRCSPEVCGLLGFDPDDPPRSYEGLFEAVHGEDREQVRSTLMEALRLRKPHSVNYRVVLPGGEGRIIYDQGEFVSDECGRPRMLVGTLQDVTAISEAEEQIRFLAFYDSLTGLANRILFKDRIEQALVSAERKGHLTALLYLDLDRFKRINDTLGHHVGDMLLKNIADRINACVRKSDSIARAAGAGGETCVSRLGGDEFTILLSEIAHPEDADKVARRIIDAIPQPLQLDGHEVFVTTSVGISIYPYDGTDADTLLKNADAAMYHAKEKGRNNYQFYKESLNAKALERLALETDIRKALERDEFVLYYQPQVETDSGRIIGCEALIRWNHPERGLVSPLDFLPVAEESGLILPINEWVLESACRQSRAWQEAGLAPGTMAVNLSGAQFSLEKIVEMVPKVVKESGVRAESIEIELTEGIIMKREETTVATLRELKSHGLRIAIDDFGTGHSSLSYLKDFPIDTLKVDRSFVRDIDTRPNDAAITRAIIAMARSLELAVVAEGVETEDQWGFLARHGCAALQGFLFSRPVPAEAFTELLRSGLPQQAPPQGGAATDPG